MSWNKKVFYILVLLLLLFPKSAVFAQGLIPCGHGSASSDACTLCDFIVGFYNLIHFGLELLITVTVVGIFIAGVMYIVSAGNEQLITKAKTFLSASLVGFTIVLTAWLLVNVAMWALSFNTSTTPTSQCLDWC